MKSHKNLVFIAMLFLAMFCTELNAQEIKLKVVNGVGPQPRSIILIPIEVYQTQTTLEIEFLSAVGNAIITVSDTESHQSVLFTIDTALFPFTDISIEDWEVGEYIINIKYLNVECAGHFNID